jgi:tetratricopeptide repeat protein
MPPANKQRAFVIRPFGIKKDSAGGTVDFDHVHAELIGPALKCAGLVGSTTGEIIEAGNIREDMFSLIIDADLIVCDITHHNANVFYELGIRHALRKKRSVLIKGSPVADATPFDILTDRYVPYSVSDPAAACADLTATIKATLASDRDTDSPVFRMLPGLREVDPAAIQAVPTDFGEDVARARAAESTGWLRLLASEVAGLRFQWPALRLVAQAQWDLKDYEGARKTWERIRDNNPDDLSANLALANLFERQSKLEKRPELLESSSLAIARVLRHDKLSAGQRAEANALRARNLKTLWRLDFEAQADLAKRRETATNRALREAYEAYRRAYLGDLNHYWSGLAALQQGTIALALSDGDVWQDTFDNSDQANAYKGELKRQVEALRPMVSQAIEAALARTDLSDDERLWAKISAADLMFLVEERSKRVVEAYKNAIPRNGRFAWDAAKGQLQLFALLAIKSDLANEVIGTMDALVDRSEPDKVARSEPDKKVLHTIVFAGHRVDEAGREKPRFPPDGETKARDLIREKLKAVVDASTRVHVLSSAAPGSDILCHEICRELAIDSTICLPMPKESFGRLVFSDEENWRARFLELASSRPVLQLSDQEDLPRWLRSSGLNAWERGNRWVLEMAQASGAVKVTLIVLWDGKTTGDAPGGTAHMVGLARDAGTVVEVRIDAGQLTA